MCEIIDDFIKSASTSYGYGFFELEGSIRHYSGLDVVDFAMKVSKSQYRKYKRYGIIPAAFFLYLKGMGLSFNVQDIPKDRTIKDVLDLLYNGSYIDDSARGNCLYLRERILKSLYPDMHVMFGVGEKLGKDLYKQKNKLSLDKRQGYKGSKKKTK